VTEELFVDVVTEELFVDVVTEELFVDVVTEELFTDSGADVLPTESVLETVSLSERTLTVPPPEAAAVTRNTARTSERKVCLLISFTSRVIDIINRIAAVTSGSGRLPVAVVPPCSGSIRSVRFGLGGIHVDLRVSPR